MKLRLNKFLARQGVASRRGADVLIQEGKVRVNGRVVNEPWFDVEPDDKVSIGRKALGDIEQLLYILLHKPVNTVSTLADEQGREIVRDLIDIPERIYPVGRLDFRTSGVLLLTNDGDLANQLIHPRYHIKKVYHVTVHKKILAGHLSRLRAGVELDDGVTQSCEVEFSHMEGARPVYRFVLQEGRNRQIRRMLEKFEYHVKRLARVEFAGITVDKMKPGEWRVLSGKELERLRKRLSPKGRQK